MKLQFDANQDYQIEAIRAVVALFAGQPDASQSAVTRQDELSSLMLSETGVANRRVIDDAQWLANLNAVQKSHEIEPSAILETMKLDDGAPVDVLLKVQLGGGTDIAKAMTYCAGLVREPARTIVVLITDFYEGGDERNLIRQVRALADAGVRQVGLGALGYDARPSYNKSTAGKCRKNGMDILACTPEKLAESMAEIIRG